ncbi:hypothetical protein NDS46_30715 (plasmid) [Paenibacillus thiaminolyticus]|uniref:hypothetical protein n=1 Tax=Paenibacillus thiaminolyticus TaxID=49283 RepID=UPI0023307B76|nr:hypothetical protein [Paenibacillus thiaminolyticus]WCF11719.1 hypothetical protein NDS46_30715 [Paenibacillus thiaminolyticus]
MKTNKIALFMAIAFVVMLLIPLAPAAYAEGNVQNFSTEGVVNPKSGTTASNGGIDKIAIKVDPNVNNGVPSVELPNVQIDQAEKYIERKGFDVVGVLQKFVQPLAIAVFIVSAIMAVVGMIGRGLIGMGIAILMYAVVLSAPEFMDFVNAWLKS